MARGEVGQQRRAAIAITLHVAAADRAQENLLLLGLDPFGYDSQTKAVAHLHDRLNDQPRLMILADRGDEIAVDLDLVDRKGAQVRQLREPGAEIIKADR